MTEVDFFDRRMKKERSFSGGFHDVSSSPISLRKRAELKKLTSTKLKNMNQSNPSIGFEITGLFIPGLDVKVFEA